MTQPCSQIYLGKNHQCRSAHGDRLADNTISPGDLSFAPDHKPSHAKSRTSNLEHPLPANFSVWDAVYKPVTSNAHEQGRPLSCLPHIPCCIPPTIPRSFPLDCNAREAVKLLIVLSKSMFRRQQTLESRTIAHRAEEIQVQWYSSTIYPARDAGTLGGIHRRWASMNL